MSFALREPLQLTQLDNPTLVCCSRLQLVISGEQQMLRRHIKPSRYSRMCSRCRELHLACGVNRSVFSEVVVLRLERRTAARPSCHAECILRARNFKALLRTWLLQEAKRAKVRKQCLRTVVLSAITRSNAFSAAGSFPPGLGSCLSTGWRWLWCRVLQDIPRTHTSQVAWVSCSQLHWKSGCFRWCSYRLGG